MTPGVALLSLPELMSTQQIARSYLESAALTRLRDGREPNSRMAVAIDMMREDGRLPPASEATKALIRNEAQDENAERADPLVDEAAARFDWVRSREIGFVERWVQFWTNHFTVSASVGFVGWMAGSYEREAIRPHALGSFRDLLRAASLHPAMLQYLNLDNSRGPRSPAGQRSGKGFNENQARELLELHTVGVDAGYTQKDVTALAYILTGSRTVPQPRDENYGGYEFLDAGHEPGTQSVMGVAYDQPGAAQTDAVLADLARRPETARHIARRLAIAFVADDPPAALVEQLSTTFRESDGDLLQLALALISSDEAWNAPRAKMRSAQEFVFAAHRVVDRAKPRILLRGMAALGQPMWRAPSPRGFSIYGRDWLAPDAQTTRLDLAVDLANDHGGDIDPPALAVDLLGDVISDETMTAVKRASSREQALALLLMSPEMQRR